VAAAWAALALGGIAAGAPALVPGITEPVHDSLLSAAAAGRVEKVHFKEGDHVDAGTVILELDQVLETLEVERRKLVWESRAALDAAEQRVAVLRADYESTKRLFERSQSVSRDEFDKKELEYKLAVAERDRLVAEKERERIEYAMAREQLARRTVVAPFAGVITDLQVDLGEACEPRQPILRLVDLGRAWFVASVAPALVDGLAPGRPARLRLETPSGLREIEGTVDYLAPVVDAGSGLRRIKIVFENPDGVIAPGASGHLVLD
jgi:RND family efflux transporter MFP subunit